MLKKLAFSLVALLLVPHLHAQTPSTTDLQKSCGSFVQSFYDWYAPRAFKDGPETAVRHKSAVFAPDLLSALKRDFAAQQKSPGELVGLDFDPFLNSQDPDGRYQLGSVTVKDAACWADVYGVTSGNKRAKPDVVPELKFQNGQWVFVNFHYGKGRQGEDINLLGTLKQLERDRHQP